MSAASATHSNSDAFADLSAESTPVSELDAIDAVTLGACALVELWCSELIARVAGETAAS